MTYILAAQRDVDPDGSFRCYRDYLESVKEKFPPSSWVLINSDWWFNALDHRCPHDAWLEQVVVTESAASHDVSARSLSLSIRLLAAYHDGHIELRYTNVSAYTLELFDGTRGHRDWRYDELRLSENGGLVHEIEWGGVKDTGRWLIEAADVEYTWIPIEDA